MNIVNKIVDKNTNGNKIATVPVQITSVSYTTSETKTDIIFNSNGYIKRDIIHLSNIH